MAQVAQCQCNKDEDLCSKPQCHQKKSAQYRGHGLGSEGKSHEDQVITQCRVSPLRRGPWDCSAEAALTQGNALWWLPQGGPGGGLGRS
jgi:hypothetical protein